jgi:hypothetical protein
MRSDWLKTMPQLMPRSAFAREQARSRQGHPRADCNRKVTELTVVGGPPFRSGHGVENAAAWSHCWGYSMHWMESQLIIYEQALAGNMVAESASHLDTHSFCTQCTRDFTIHNTTYHPCYVGNGNHRRWMAREHLDYTDAGLGGAHDKNAKHWAWAARPTDRRSSRLAIRRC